MRVPLRWQAFVREEVVFDLHSVPMSGPLRRLILRTALAKRPTLAVSYIRPFSTEGPSNPEEGVVTGVEQAQPEKKYGLEDLEKDLKAQQDAQQQEELQSLADGLGPDISEELSSELGDMMSFMEEARKGEAKQAVGGETDEYGRVYATGRRKTAQARVWIFPGPGRITVNHKSMVDYFVRDSSHRLIVKPFEVTETAGQYDVWCTVKGGGLRAQANAIRLGISRALNYHQPHVRPFLKAEGFLTRDARKVEKKKPGQPKARKKRQWVKR